MYSSHLKIRRYSMIANETVLHQIPNEIKFSNYRTLVLAFYNDQKSYNIARDKKDLK